MGLRSKVKLFRRAFKAIFAGISKWQTLGKCKENSRKKIGLAILVASTSFALLELAATPAMGAYVEILTTKNWFQISTNRVKDLKGYAVFRRYSVVINKNVSGQPTFDDLRNSISYNCSLNEANPSFLTFYIPREIDLPALLGNLHFTDHNIEAEFKNKKRINLTVEIIKNEIFVDHVWSNRRFFYSFAGGEPFILWFDENLGVSFGEADQKMLDFGSSKLESYDNFIEGQLNFNFPSKEIGGADSTQKTKKNITAASTGEILDLCK